MMGGSQAPIGWEVLALGLPLWLGHWLLLALEPVG